MNTVKQRLENILLELELSMQKLLAQKKMQAIKLSPSNKIILKRLKGLQHMLVIASKITDQILTDKTDLEKSSN